MKTKRSSTSATTKKRIIHNLSTPLIAFDSIKSKGKSVITNNSSLSISDLKDLVSSRSDSIKRDLDLYDSEIMKELEVSQSRLSKKFKMQTQACQQMMDEAEKDHKKMSDRITESVEIMKASYTDFITEAQNTTAKMCTTTIPELAKSMEKAIDGLRSCYGIPLASV